MKNILLFFLIFLFMEGVFGETVTVMKGDSVTLHTGLTKMALDVMDWRFTKNRIARLNTITKISTKYHDVLNGKFRDRLEVNIQNGDLTIRNIENTDIGIYEVDISDTEIKTFNVTVKQGEVGESQSVSVLRGDKVTLNTDATDVLTYDLIQWRFKQHCIAEINRTAVNTSTFDGPDKIFRSRLQVTYLTGSLTIENIGTNHSGLYDVDIRSSNKHTLHSTFNVTVNDQVKSLSVIKGDLITLNTDTDLQTYDVMLWIFGDIFIAEIHKATELFYTNNGSDSRFKNRLKLDRQTGSLNITNITTEDAGIFDLKISSSRHTIHKRINVAVNEMKSLSVIKGESLPLLTETEIQRDDLIMWKFGDTQIAEMNKINQRLSTSPDGRFRDRLKLDHKTGSLTITNITTEHAGLYDLKISNNSRYVHKRISVTVNEMKSLSVVKGESLPLLTETEIQKDDLIMWKFGDTQIAEMHITEQRFSTSLDGRFRDRLKLDPQTGSLNITNTKVTDSGLYELKISSSRRTVHKKFTVTVTEAGLSTGAKAGIVFAVLLPVVAAAIGMIYCRRKIAELKRKEIEAITVTEESIAPLRSGVLKIQRDDVVQWMFRDEQFPIAQIKKGQNCLNDGPDERFKGRLTLDNTTGSLTITDTRTTDSGHYKLNIISSGTSSTKLYSLTVTVETISKKEGDPVILTTKAEIERDDQMLLLFGEEEFCIGQIKGGTEEFSTYDNVHDDRFKGRLELNKKTRSVNITNTSTKDSGLYKLLIIGSGTVTSKIFNVSVSGDTASRGNRPEELPLMGVDVSNSRL